MFGRQEQQAHVPLLVVGVGVVKFPGCITTQALVPSHSSVPVTIPSPQSWGAGVGVCVGVDVGVSVPVDVGVGESVCVGVGVDV
jgi:hypothetical protein